jgi:hypothetical protein
MLRSSALALTALAWASCSGLPKAREAISTTPATSVFKLESVATWRGNTLAAYSLIHDDVCDDNLDPAFSIAAPELKKRGFHAGFGVIVSFCKRGGVDKWPAIRALIAEGHDIFSHSWSHPCIDGDTEHPPEECPPPQSSVYSGDIATEIGRAGQELQARTGAALDYFIFPYDYCAPRAVDYLKSHGYLGARCGLTSEAPVTAPTFSDPFGAYYDVFGPAYSYYWNSGPCQGKITQFETPPSGPKAAPKACVEYVQRQYVEDTIAKKGWGIREFHGFQPGVSDAFEPVSETDYLAHLDYLKQKVDSGSLWVEGPSRVLRYRFARSECSAPKVSGRTLHFGEASTQCRKYHTVLSYLVSADAQSKSHVSYVLQAGERLPARQLRPGHLVIDADPTRGDAVLVE